MYYCENRNCSDKSAHRLIHALFIPLSGRHLIFSVSAIHFVDTQKKQSAKSGVAFASREIAQLTSEGSVGPMSPQPGPS